MQQHADVVTDLKGNVIKAAKVRVLLLNGALATIYAGNGGAPTDNPLLSGTRGEFSFYAPNGDYKLEIVVENQVFATVGPVTLYDVGDDTDRASWSSLGANDGATRVGYGSGSVAEAIAARATLYELAAADGATKVGYGAQTVDTALDGLYGALTNPESANWVLLGQPDGATKVGYGSQTAAQALDTLQAADAARPTSTALAATDGSTRIGHGAGTVSTALAALQAADADRPTSAALAATDGATKIGFGGGNVSSAITALQTADAEQVTFTELAAADGATKVGGTWFGSIIANLSALATSGGSSLIGWIQAGSGAIARSVKDKLRDTISIKDFGAKGDGVTDDTACIQAAINYMASIGGGILRVPSGYKFRYTSPLYIKANVILEGDAVPGFYYPANGSCLIADFANPNAWAIESDTTIVAGGARVNYRDATSGTQVDVGTITRNENCGVRHLFIDVPNNNLYGGLRLMGCPGFIVDAVGVRGSDVGFLFCASWGAQANRLWSLTHLYGIAGTLDLNGSKISGYFDRVAGSVKTVTAANRPNWIVTIDIGAAVETRDFKDDTIGILLYYTNAIVINGAVCEHWQVGRAYIKANATTEHSAYSEGNTKTILALVGGQYVGNTLYSNDTTLVGNAYEFGVNVNAHLNAFPAKAFNSSQYAYVQINDARADALGWTYNANLRYPGEKLNVIRISASGSASAIGSTSTYTTLDKALARIVASGPGSYRILVKDGDTVILGTSPTLHDTAIEVMREGSGTNPVLLDSVAGGYPQRIIFSGNSSLSILNVNLAFSASTTATDASDRGMFVPASQATGGSFRFSSSGNTIDLQSSWAIFQQRYETANNITATWSQVTINGSGTSVILASSVGNASSANVISLARAATVAASIKALGVNGWMNANVVTSNF